MKAVPISAENNDFPRLKARHAVADSSDWRPNPALLHRSHPLTPDAQASSAINMSMAKPAITAPTKVTAHAVDVCAFIQGGITASADTGTA
jgi:hypothetical protein